MSAEVNYAELQRQFDTNPTLEMCQRQGGTHAAYGWTTSIAGHYNEEQKAAYMNGYCPGSGRYHAEQGWKAQPSSYWTDAQKAAYMDGYRAYHEAQKQTE